jgi:hypothetical protein
VTAGAEVALVWALLSAPADASVMRWEGAAGCPDEAIVVGAVERYLGGSIGASTGDDKRIAATASKQRGGWVAKVEVIEASGNRTRTLPAAPTCAEAAEAAALVIAISIDPEAVERTEAAREEGLVPAPKAEVTPESEVAAKSEAAPKKDVAPKSEAFVEPVAPKVAPEPVRPPSRPALRGAVGIHGGIEFGALPRVTGIVGASVSLLGAGFRVFVDANVLPQQRLAIGSARVDFRLWAVGVGGCPVVNVARQWSIAPCIAFEAGQAIGVRTSGFASTGAQRAVWVAGRLITRVEWRPHRLVGLHVAPELVVPFVRPEFFVNDEPEPEHAARPAGVRGTLGVEVQFP